MGDIKIKLVSEFDYLTKLYCWNSNCIHNVSGESSCNLKSILINPNNCCENMQDKRKEETKTGVSTSG